MKKLLQKSIALALAAITAIASTAIVAFADDTTAATSAATSAATTEAVVTTTSGSVADTTVSGSAGDTTVADTTAASGTTTTTAATTTTTEFDDGLINLAKLDGVSYTLARLVADPESEEEGIAQFLSYLADNEFVKLNDGETNKGVEIPNKSVGFAGTARSHRIKFDLGSTKTVSRVVLLNMWNSYKAVDSASGKPAGNRGYELETMTVLTGDDELTMFKVETTNTEKDYAENERFHKVTLTLAQPTATRYIWIDIQSAQPGLYGTPDDMGAYIVSLDEVEIYGEDGAADVPGSSAADTTTSAVNENAVYDLEVSAPANVKAGEKINVVISTKNIKSENGLMAVSFTLTYDSAKVTPDVVSADPEKCEIYDDLMTTVPMYTMSVAGMDIPTKAYENISRNYDGYYEFTFLDKISYPMQKAGEEVNTKLVKDGDLVITVPFTVKEDVADGDIINFVVSNVGGTDAGNADVQPFSVEGNGGKAAVSVGDAVVTTTTSNDTTTTVAGTTVDTTVADTTVSTPSTTPSTSSSSIALIVVLAFVSLAAAGAVVVKKSR